MRTEGNANPNVAVEAWLDNRGVLNLVFNRPEKSNAFNAQTIQAMTAILERYCDDTKVRCLVLSASGKHFSAGADLHWMKSMSHCSNKDNFADAKSLATLLHQLDHFPVPTIAVVQGSAYGGAIGLICCCDIALATNSARFCLSETRLGLVPATIAPYVIRAMGSRQARYYMLTATPFNAEKAEQLNVIHQWVAQDTLEQSLEAYVSSILCNAPRAISNTKQLCFRCDGYPIDEDLMNTTSQVIADARVGVEGQEGIEAYFNKRQPYWACKEKKETK